MATLLTGDLRPKQGDLVLARVEVIGRQSRIEKPNGRRAFILPGDEVLVCYGNRYAPDQYEALIGDNLGPCDLVAAGGVASNEVVRHDRMPPPTRIAPIGIVGDRAGERINLSSFRVIYNPKDVAVPRVVAVAGTSMNSGKTYTAASIVRSLSLHGYRVAGIKVTGTGSGGDLWKMRDMGAEIALDFTDGGFASTYLADIDDVLDSSIGLLNFAARRGCEFAIVEIADGLKQYETATLLQSNTFRAIAPALVFAAYDSMGAKAGYDALRDLGYSVLALSGQLTRSPLSMREASAEVSCQVFTAQEIQGGALVSAIVGQDNAGALGAIRRFLGMAKKLDTETCPGPQPLLTYSARCAVGGHPVV